MKRTPILKTVLLMITLSFIYTFTAFASESPAGCLDVFTEDKISGWACFASGQTAVPELQIIITNSVTGEKVKELNVSPSYERADLTSSYGTNTASGFAETIDMSSLPDGSYCASMYHGSSKFANTLYYTKGAAASSINGASLHALGVFRLTAYCPCNGCSEGWGRHTSSGALASADHTVAVDPRVIPLGSKVLINGTVYTAEDIGGAVKGSHIDIYFNTHGETREFGSRTAEVYLLQ